MDIRFPVAYADIASGKFLRLIHFIRPDDSEAYAAGSFYALISF